MPQGPLWKIHQHLVNKIHHVYSQAEKKVHIKLQGFPKNLVCLMREGQEKLEEDPLNLNYLGWCR